MIAENVERKYYSLKNKEIKPYINGYMYVSFKLPLILKEKLNNIGIHEPEKILSNLCTGVLKLPNKRIVDGKILFDHELTLEYIEFENIPLFTIHDVWFKLIESDVINHTHKLLEYSAQVEYWTTTAGKKKDDEGFEDGKLQFLQKYKHVYPLHELDNLYSTNVRLESVDKLIVPVTYNATKN